MGLDDGALGELEGLHVGLEGVSVGSVVGMVDGIMVVVGEMVGLALYAQHFGEVGDRAQLFVGYGPATTPGGQVDEQYPALTVGLVHVAVCCNLSR